MAATASSASEVSPYLAMDTKGTIAEAERLWKDVQRKNPMVKVPATPEGLPAIEQLIGEGISINITLLFSQEVYREVAEAYLEGPGEIRRQGRRSLHVASVASFFVSRIDTRGRQAARREDRQGQRSVREGAARRAEGQGRHRQRKAGLPGLQAPVLRQPLGQSSKAKGAKPQRLLWASTGTKNKDYSDVLYVEELIGPDTVNTVPPATLDAFRDHGKVRDSLEENVEDARRVLEELEQVRHLARRHHRRAGQGRRQAVRRRGRQALWRGRPQARDLARWRHRPSETRARRHHREGGREEHRGVARLGQDPPALAEGQVGLDRRRREQMAGLADQPPRPPMSPTTRIFRAAREGTELHRRRRARHGRIEPRAGGAGARPSRTNPASRGCMCSTPPIRRRCARWRSTVDIAKTLFIVSSKSGGTTEPNVMKDYFFDRVAKAIGKDKAGHRFIAVTDPGSSLQKVAIKQGFARIFYGDPAIGGRYSVLSPFGLVPAAAAGIDVRSLLSHALAMVRSCGADVPPHENPGVQLGLAMGIAGLEGRDKVTIFASPDGRGFRRLGRAADRGIHRQGRQGPDPDRGRDDRRCRRLRQRPLLHRPAHRRRERCRA